MQRDELLEFAHARGWTIIEVYEDRRTGTNTKRPGLQKLLKDLKQHKVDAILCWKLDRVFRSLIDLCSFLQLIQSLSDEGHSVEFCSLNDPGITSLTSGSGKMLAQLLGIFAEFESGLIKMRVRAGIHAKIRRTGRWGRPKLRDDQKIHELRAKGLSIRAISKEVGISPASVQRALKGK
jgi:DNA invertase Pin-like site-specific DNA recombinase